MTDCFAVLEVVTSVNKLNRRLFMSDITIIYSFCSNPQFILLIAFGGHGQLTLIIHFYHPQETTRCDCSYFCGFHAICPSNQTTRSLPITIAVGLAYGPQEVGMGCDHPPWWWILTS